MKIKQGDAYKITFTPKLNGEIFPSTGDNVINKIEMYLGPIRKYFDLGTYQVDISTHKCSVPFTQQETFQLTPPTAVLDIRVITSGGDVIGLKPQITVDVIPATSREVL